jgi:hypothetical protein
VSAIVTVPEIPTIAIVPHVPGIHTAPKIADEFQTTIELVTEMGRVATWSPGDDESLGAARDNEAPIRSIR